MFVTPLNADWEEGIGLDMESYTDKTKDSIEGANWMNSGKPVAATATFTLSDKPVEGSTITLTDTNGTSATFEIDNENDGVTSGNVAVDNIYASGAGAKGTATDLVAKINAQSSLDIVATNPSDGKVVLTQGSGGGNGNVTISVDSSTNWNNASSVNVPSAFFWRQLRTLDCTRRLC